jgi:purine-binding chemotaxis protein CheW
MEMIEHITPLPNSPNFVEGVVFTRGQVIPAVNLRTRFGFDKVPQTIRTRLIVTNHKGRIVGLIVDSAREFMSISKESIQAPPATMMNMSSKYLCGIVTEGERLVFIIDLDDLLRIGETRAEAPESITGESDG